MADQVMRMPAVQRNDLDEDQMPELMIKREPAQAADGAFEAGDEFARQLRATRGQGQPLPARLRAEFEAKVGADFGTVSICTGDQAVHLTHEIQAQAFTKGSDVFFGAGKYDPDTTAGKWLLAHELTHVVQQGAAPLKHVRAHQQALGACPRQSLAI
ncbi:MAG: DUF4157 domain-containing protein [Gammaproteobacteria bacterium]